MSMSTQISESLTAIDSNNIPVNHLWLNVGPERASQPDVQCNAWQLGSAGNETLAKQSVAVIKALPSLFDGFWYTETDGC